MSITYKRLVDSFFGNIKIVDSGCWEYTGYRYKDTRPRIRVYGNVNGEIFNGEKIIVSRLSAFLFMGFNLRL